MLKNQGLQTSKRRTVELRNTLGESVRDSIIEAGIKAAKEAGYAAGNKTDTFVEVAQKIGDKIDGATALGGGVESASSVGRIALKATKDVARGDTVCTGLCLVSGACETIALGCSTIKIIPYRGHIYIGAKIVSRGCMSFRNACAADGC